MTTQIAEQLFDAEQAVSCLEALHFHGFTVTIHSPKTTSDGLYSVTAYGHEGRRNVVHRGSSARLDAAIRQVARQLSDTQLRAYTVHALGVHLAALNAGERAEASA